MERTDTRAEVDELDLTLLGYLPEEMPQKFWVAYARLKQLAKQSSWPNELYAQYLKVLDQRDALQGKIDRMEYYSE